MNFLCGTYIFDYADVISFPQDLNEFYAMADLLKLDHNLFKELYWKYRRPYDLGQRGEDYWKLVSGKDLSKDTIQKLIDHDCRSWLRVNPFTVKLLFDLHAAGKRLALLSNLPIELVNALRTEHSFLSVFEKIFFSAEIHLVKPDIEIYQYALRELKVNGRDVLFFDDKQENLEGAHKLSINTFLFEKDSAEKLLHMVKMGL